jgi:VWFA-related protein
MKNRKALLWVCAVCALVLSCNTQAQTQQNATDEPILRTTSGLVVLDVTVLDKKSKPVTKGLLQEDFVITQDKAPQKIFSFEPPEAHGNSAAEEDNQGDNNAPVTILVLDLLNTKFEDTSYIRYHLRKFLESQPDPLPAPAELLVLGNSSLEMLQGYTRSRSDLLFALKHLPPVYPYKAMNPEFGAERFMQSIEAMQQIALQNNGISGHKNVIWIGGGTPTLTRTAITAEADAFINRYVHTTTNMLVSSRISLFAIFPSLQYGQWLPPWDLLTASDSDGGDPFSTNINFGVFARETGGYVFANRNDIDGRINAAEEIGSNYYTLSYVPPHGGEDGRFRFVHIAMRDPNLKAMTKDGFFSDDKETKINPHQQMVLNIGEASHASIPFSNIEVKVSNLMRHPDSRTAEFTVVVPGKYCAWHGTPDGGSAAALSVAAVSLDSRRGILASNVQKATIRSPLQDNTKLNAETVQFSLTVRIPRRTQSVRVTIGAEETGRIGTTDVDQRALNAAPETPTPPSPPATPPAK